MKISFKLGNLSGCEGLVRRFVNYFKKKPKLVGYNHTFKNFTTQGTYTSARQNGPTIVYHTYKGRPRFSDGSVGPEVVIRCRDYNPHPDSKLGQLGVFGVMRETTSYGTCISGRAGNGEPGLAHTLNFGELVGYIRSGLENKK